MTSAREIERQIIECVVDVATGKLLCVCTLRDANVCRIASELIRGSLTDECARLKNASDAYFLAHPSDLLPPEEVIRMGWIVGLPRFRDRVDRLIAARVGSSP